MKYLAGLLITFLSTSGCDRASLAGSEMTLNSDDIVSLYNQYKTLTAEDPHFEAASLEISKWRLADLVHAAATLCFNPVNTASVEARDAVSKQLASANAKKFVAAFDGSFANIGEFTAARGITDYHLTLEDFQSMHQKVVDPLSASASPAAALSEEAATIKRAIAIFTYASYNQNIKPGSLALLGTTAVSSGPRTFTGSAANSLSQGAVQFHSSGSGTSWAQFGRTVFSIASEVTGGFNVLWFVTDGVGSMVQLQADAVLGQLQQQDASAAQQLEAASLIQNQTAQQSSDSWSPPTGTCDASHANQTVIPKLSNGKNSSIIWQCQGASNGYFWAVQNNG